MTLAWRELRHAYGSAEDLPRLLAAVRAADPTVAAEALHALAHRVHQQGMTYPATAYVVPSLVALASSRCPLRVRVLRVLGAIAARPDARVREALFMAEPALVALLSDEDADVRAASAAVLSRVATLADETRAALSAHVDDDARVRFGIALALMRNGGHEPWITRVADALDEPLDWLTISGDDARTAALEALLRDGSPEATRRIALLGHADPRAR